MLLWQCDKVCSEAIGDKKQILNVESLKQFLKSKTLFFSFARSPRSRPCHIPSRFIISAYIIPTFKDKGLSEDAKIVFKDGEMHTNLT